MEPIREVSFLSTLIPLGIIVVIIAVGVILLTQVFHKNIALQKLRVEKIKTHNLQELLKSRVDVTGQVHQQNPYDLSESRLKDQIHLTKREEEILKLTCQEFTPDEIAERFVISANEVNGHLDDLLQKTGCRNIAGVVVYAIKNNIVPIVKGKIDSL